ncbi:hypothetical protein AO203_04250 [Lactobacillus gallinarum]|nr:hypothetical protein AO203_04250 [Lactobacillus gallinarum]
MKVKIDSRIFAIFFFILIETMYGFELTFIRIPNDIYTVLLYTSVFCFLCAISMTKWTVSEATRAICMLVIALAVYISSKESLYFLLMFAGIIMHCINYKDALITIFITRLFILFWIILLSLFNVIPINEMSVSKGVSGSAVGYGLGFIHPNDLAQAIFILCIIYLCIRRNKIDIKDKILFFLVTVINYSITKSRTIFIISIFILFMLIINNFNLGNKMLIYSAIPIYIVAVLISLVIPYLYNESTGILRNIAFIANGILSGRFSNASMLFQNFPVTLFGKIVNTDILQSIYGYDVIDNGYVFLLFNYGIIGSLTILILYFYVIKKLIKRKEIVYLIMVLAFLLLGTMENVIRSVAVNFTMIFWYEFIRDSKNNIGL